MKKTYNILTIMFLSLLFINCDSEQAGQDVAEIGSTDRYPTPSFNFEGSTTVNEGQDGEQTILTYTITFDRPIDRPVDFQLVQTGGDATLHEDFDFVNTSVPAYGTSAEAQIIIYNDEIIEGAETLEFEIQRGESLANRYLIHPDTEFPDPITITIENYESDNFVATFDWSGTYSDAGGVEHDLCDLDFDLEIYPEDFSEILMDSYNDCPESITLSPGDLLDGTYYIVPSFWSTNDVTPPAENINFETTLTFSQPGAQTETVEINDFWDFNSGGIVQGNTSGAYYVEYKLEVSGDNFTVTNSDGNLVFEQ